jgi:hypothetical protein
MKLGDNFLWVPKLASDGKNYVIYKDRLILSLDAWGISGHLDGTSKEPVEPVVVNSTKLTAVERTAKGIWDLLKKDFEKRSQMFMVDLRWRLQDKICGKGNDVWTHFDTMHTMCEDLAAMGTRISNEDFTVMILGLLPTLYDTYLSAITATVSVINTALDPEALIVSIIDEYDWRTVKLNKNKKDDKNTAFYAGNLSKGSKKGHGGSKKNIECFNCKKRGHVKADCWAKGGRNEAQWESTQGRNSQFEGNGSWSYGSRSLLKLLFPSTECRVAWRDIVSHCNHAYK